MLCCSAATSLTIVHALIHVAKGMAVSCDTFNDARRQQVLRRGAIKDPIFFVGEIGEAGAFAHVEANGGLFYIDVKIVFFHGDNSPGLETKLAPAAFKGVAERRVVRPLNGPASRHSLPRWRSALRLLLDEPEVELPHFYDLRTG